MLTNGSAALQNMTHSDLGTPELLPFVCLNFTKNVCVNITYLDHGDTKVIALCLLRFKNPVCPETQLGHGLKFLNVFL